MSLGWYVRRLANMSPLEVAHRVGEQAKRAASRRRTYGWERFPAPAGLRPVPALADTLRARATPAMVDALGEETAALLGGRFAALGTTWPTRPSDRLFPDEVWRLDPVTGRLWPGPERFCFDLPYRHVREFGDVKYVWEFNRLQFLQPLAAAVALTGDPQALAAIEAAIHGWARANPPFRGIAWNSGIELALRSVSLVLVQALCGDRVRPDTRALIGSVLHASLYWLARYPSAFSSANNHLVAEMLGIFVITSVFPSERPWTSLHGRARAALDREARLQILPDGVGAEQSPTYAAFTAEMLLVADAVGRAFGAPLGTGVAGRLEAFVGCIAWLADRRGIVPGIGDDDGGRVLTLRGSHDETYPASVARAIAGHLGCGTSVPASAGAPDLREALFGRPAPLPEPSGLRTFAAGGYTVVRERRGGRRLRFVIDHGPLGYLSIAAHGHADANAVTLSLDDEDVLVDPGTYLYHSGGAWRDWFRGTRAHNTVALAGLDQSVISGPFNWSSKAKADLDGVEPGEAWALRARHDGYRRRLGAEHVREVRATGAGLTLLDTVPGARGDLNAEVTLQFAPSLDVRPDGSNWNVYKDESKLLEVEFRPVSAGTKLIRGSDVEGGWFSPGFGRKQEAARLVWSGNIPQDGLRTILTWG